MEAQVNEYTENQVCKSFAFRDGAVNRGMSVMPYEKLKKNIK